MKALWAAALATCCALTAHAGDQPPPPPITINWDRVGAAGVGLVAGLVGMLVGGATGSTVGCAVETLATGDCGELRVVPSIIFGLAVGAAAGYVAVQLYWGELTENWDPHQPNVGAPPAPTGLTFKLEF